MAANIITIINGDETTRMVGTSRDDLKVGDTVQCVSLDAAVDSGYTWSLPHIPNGSSTTLAVDDNSCEFTVDKEGPYLVRLIVDAGSEYEDSQYLRLRSPTRFGALRLVAAGEQLGDLAIPSDMTGSGWADDQNFNLNVLVSELSALATSGRVLYVDPNRGVDDTVAPNEDISGYGNFHSIQEAIDAAVGNIVTPATSDNEWSIIVRQGRYVEDLQVPQGINLFGAGDVHIENTGDANHHIFTGGLVRGIEFHSNNLSNLLPIISIEGSVVFEQCTILRLSNVAGQGACVSVTSGVGVFKHCEIGNSSYALLNSIAIGVQGNAELEVEDCHLYGAQGVVIYEGAGEAEITRSVVEGNHVSGSAILSSGTLDVSYSELISDTSHGLKVTPSDTDGTGGGRTHVRFSKILNDYEYDFSMEVSEIKLVGVEFESSTAFDGDADFSGNVEVQGYVGANAIVLSSQSADMEDQENTQSTVWVDGSQNLNLDGQKIAFTTEVQAVGEEVDAVNNSVDDLTQTVAMLVAQVQSLEETVATLSGSDHSDLNYLHREVVEDLFYECHDCDEYIGVRTQAGQDHVIQLEEDAASGRRLYIVDETGLGRILIRPISAQPDPTINGEVGDYILKNRQGVHIVSNGSTDDTPVNWTVS